MISSAASVTRALPCCGHAGEPMPCTSQCPWHRTLLLQATSQGSGYQDAPSRPHSGLWCHSPGTLELTLCQPVPGTGTGGWSCSLTDGLCAAKGHVPLKGRMLGWRLAGWYNLIRLGSATHPCAVSEDHCSGAQNQAGPHCCHLWLLCCHIAFSHCCFPCYLCSLYFFPLLMHFFAVIFDKFSPPSCLWFLPATHYEASPSHLIILVAKLFPKSRKVPVLTLEKTIFSEIHCCFCAPYSIPLSSLWE